MNQTKQKLLINKKPNEIRNLCNGILIRCRALVKKEGNLIMTQRLCKREDRGIKNKSRSGGRDKRKKKIQHSIWLRA